MKPAGKYTVSAFSLIEMLVTIMVILILAAIIIPVVKMRKRRPVRRCCRNHLRELQTAALSYATENGGSLPCSIP